MTPPTIDEALAALRQVSRALDSSDTFDEALHTIRAALEAAAAWCKAAEAGKGES